MTHLKRFYGKFIGWKVSLKVYQNVYLIESFNLTSHHTLKGLDLKSDGKFLTVSLSKSIVSMAGVSSGNKMIIFISSLMTMSCHDNDHHYLIPNDLNY